MKDDKAYQEIKLKEDPDDINRPSDYLDWCCSSEISAMMGMFYARLSNTWTIYM